MGLFADAEILSFLTEARITILLWQPKRPARKVKEVDEEGWQLSRFYPLLQVHGQLAWFMVWCCSQDLD